MAWSLLHDIAFLYVFLAADTDGTLSEVERELIITRLHTKMAEESVETIEQVVAEAERSLRSEERSVRAIIEALKYSRLSDEQRAALLGDLVEIARADGEIHDNETAFLRALARIWSIDLPNAMGPAVHDLALVYLFMAIGTGHKLNGVKQDALTMQLRQWRPGLTPKAIQDILKDAAQQLQNAENGTLQGAIDALKKGLPDAPQRRAILDAVMRIAQADGDLSGAELAFFIKLKVDLDLHAE